MTQIKGNDLHEKEEGTGTQRYETGTLPPDVSWPPGDAARPLPEQGQAGTSQRHVSGAWHESEAWFRAIFEGSATGIVIVDMLGQVLRHNPVMEEFLGYSAEELSRMTFRDYSYPEDLDQDLAYFGELAEGKRESYQIEKRHLRKSGEVIWGSVIVSRVPGVPGRPPFAIRVVQDINRRKQAEESLRAAAAENARLLEQAQRGREQLQALSRRLLEVQEDERRALARELHDESGQALTTLKIRLGLLQHRLATTPQLAEEVQELKRMTDGVLEGLHRLSRNLRPASLDTLGLVPAVRQHIQSFEAQTGIRVAFVAVRLGEERLPAEVETVLYRVVQEALTNVGRHARASEAAVILKRKGDRVMAIVEDFGLGFDLKEALERGRLGLVGMRERAEMLGGRLVIESAIGQGTTVFVELPHPAPSSEEPNASTDA